MCRWVKRKGLIHRASVLIYLLAKVSRQDEREAVRGGEQLHGLLAGKGHREASGGGGAWGGLGLG